MATSVSPVVPYEGGKQLAIVPKADDSLAAKTPPKAIAAWDTRSDAAAWASPDEVKKPWYWELEGRMESLTLLFLAVLDNLLCYVTYFQVRAFHERLYTIVDVQLALLPGLDAALLVFTMLGTCLFLMMLVAIECSKRPLFHEIMNLRLYFSALPCALINFIVVWNSEESLYAPFAALSAILLYILAWCLHMRLHYSHQLNVMSKILLDVSWFLAFVCGATLAVLFASHNLKAITSSGDLQCPFAANAKMPVKWLILDRWYCAKWDADGDGGRMDLSRTPVNVDSPTQLSCSDSFITAFGVSLEPHVVLCPQGCLRTHHGSNIIGCGIYAANSPICLAAIHAGMLTDAGGQTTVFGRVGIPLFERCSRYSIISDKQFVTKADQVVSMSQPSGGGSSTFLASSAGGARRLVTTPLVLAADGVQIPQAFHFNNQPQTQEYIWLKSYQVVSSKDPMVEDGKPWTRIKATVSARIAGLEIEDEEITLGNPPFQPLFVVPRQGQVFEEVQAECRVRSTGVHCRGTGSAVIQLDFCQSEVKTCL